jgi:hypothetical protein
MPFRHAPGHVPGAVGAFLGIGQHQFGPQEVQQAFAALARVRGHAQGHPVAPGRRDLGKGDPSVAAGGVQQGARAILEQAARLGVADHPQRWGP